MLWYKTSGPEICTNRSGGPNMGLRINTNVASLNGQRNLRGTSNDMRKAMERLSSGYRINKAGDDAAGLRDQHDDV